jgi:mono/diheme cytochrome c family protein
MNTSATARAALLFAAFIVVASLLVGCGAAPPASTTTDGQALVAEQCGRCHAIEQVNGAKKDRAGWTATVARMRTNGLDVTDEQAAAIVDYLTKRDGGQ